MTKIKDQNIIKQIKESNKWVWIPIEKDVVEIIEVGNEKISFEDIEEKVINNWCLESFILHYSPLQPNETYLIDGKEVKSINVEVKEFIEVPVGTVSIYPEQIHSDYGFLAKVKYL